MVLTTTTELFEAPSTPQKLQDVSRPTTPSTRPGTPSQVGAVLSSRVAVLKELADKAPNPSLSLMWPHGRQPETTLSFPDEALWQEILVRVGACGVPATRDAEHFEEIVKAGMDANAVRFPRMHQRTGFPKVLPWPCLDASKVPSPYQDHIAFPLLPRISFADVQCKSDADTEAFDKMLSGRAKAPHDLRESFYTTPPLDMELSSWPVLQESVIAADACTEGQLRVWKLREERPMLPEQIEKRHAILSQKLGGKFNSCVLDELRPTLSREAALLELKASRAKDKAKEAEQYDGLAEKGAPFVAWVMPHSRQWPAQPSSWKQHCKWFAMWRAQPIVPSSFAFKPLKRSDSNSSLSSWAAVSDVSWMEVESKALECGWQEVLDEQRPALSAACTAPMHLRKQDLVELNSFSMPPDGVVLTMEVVCILLQESPKKLRGGGLDYWATAKEVMNSMNFLERLFALNDYVPASALEAVAPYMCRDEFTPENIKKQSVACEGLCRWARELYKYHVLSQASAEATRREFAAKPTAELLAGSQEAAQHLDKSRLQELKVLAKPPREVAVVVSCLLHLFAGVDAEMTWIPSKDRSWKISQKLLGNPSGLLDRMLKLPDAIVAGKVPRRNIERVRRIQVSMGSAFSRDAMLKKSIAVAGICSWLLNIVAFYDLAAPVRHEESQTVAAKKDSGIQEAGFPIDKADLAELRAMAKPPATLMVVCMCVCILRPLGTEDVEAGWAGAKAMLSDPSLLKALSDFKAENVQEEQMTRVRELMSRNKQAFEHDSLKQVSLAACGLLRWIHAVIEDYEASGGSKME